MSKLPDSIAWSESSKTLLEQTDKESAKAVVTAIGKAAEAKDTKEAAMQCVTDLAKWAKENNVVWTESYIVTLLPQVMALCADKQKPVQLKAEEAGAAMVRARPVPNAHAPATHAPATARDPRPRWRGAVASATAAAAVALRGAPPPPGRIRPRARKYSLRICVLSPRR